ncbi:TPA: polysaccharide deacetylase family protein [Streptococcus suis]
MRKQNVALLVVNSILFLVCLGMLVFAYGKYQEQALRDDVKQLKLNYSKESNVYRQAGKIGSEFVQVAIPEDEAGNPISVIQKEVLALVKKQFGQEGPQSRTTGLHFFSVDKENSEYKDIIAYRIRTRPYKVRGTKLVSQKKQDVEQILLTAEQEVFSLKHLVEDQGVFRAIVSSHLQRELASQGMEQAEIDQLLQKFGQEDVENLSFSYRESQFLLNLPEGYQVETLAISISELYDCLSGHHLTVTDQENYDKYQKEKEELANQKRIALTFDDGPNRQTTPKILDILKKYNVKATFFILGKNIAGNEDIIQRMVAEGHEIGNHTWNHPKLTGISPEAVQSEVGDTQAALEKILGYKPKLMRPPYGAVNQATMNIINMPIIYWSVDSNDWSSRNPAVILETIKANTIPGSIVLLHDIHPTSVESVEPTLQYFASQGFKLVTSSELLGQELNPQLIYYNQFDAGPGA